jgi:rod shape-determining protein MreC
MKRSDGTIFIAIVAISLSFILIDSHTPLHGIRRGVSSLTYPARKLFEFSGQLADANRRVDELSRAVMRFALENARLQEYRWENQRLREIVGFEKEGYYGLIAAEVVGRHVLPPVTSLSLSKGKADGIKVGMPVCVGDGLVGKVTDVYTNTSLVQTLYDRNCTVSCIVEPGREVGILRSTNGEELRLTGIPFDTYIAEGSEVLSSGLGGIFPKGFRVGEVESVSPDNLGLFSRVRIRPYVGFSKVGEVFIITHKREEKLIPRSERETMRAIIPSFAPESIPEFIDEIHLLRQE